MGRGFTEAELAGGPSVDDLTPVLPTVQLDAPMAVLLVELSTRSVVHANEVAEQLAPGVRLPARVDAWSDAAALRDAGGDELSETSHPLSLVAGGQTVSGQTVTAERTSELGAQRTPLWVVGVPLTGERLGGYGLVVLMPLRDRDAAGAVAQAVQVESALRERALVATGVTFTIADARAEDQPLLWVNPAFTAVTGYTFEDAVGRNCRFLQGPETDQKKRRELREALEAGRSITTTLLNYRKDGSAFWNLVAINPVHDEAGVLTHFVGIQSDVTARVTADAERDRALAAERAAKAAALRAQAQLALLAEASGEFAATLEVSETVHRLLRLTVPALADWAMVVLFDDLGGFSHIEAVHRDGRQDELDRYVSKLWASLTDASPIHQQLRGGRAWLAPQGYASLPERSRYVRDPETLELSEQLGLHSVMFVPLPGRRHVLGSVVLARGAQREVFTDQDLKVAEDLGRRAGLTLDNARLYEGEHHIAETLQRSLLPIIPDVPGLEVQARYRAGQAIAEVGGDFYDVLPLPGDSVGVVIGDVIGHDLAAAAAMGQLRGLLRACAWEAGDGGPGEVLQRLDRIVQGLQTVPMATLGYATLSRPSSPGGSWRLGYSSAGHPPMLLRRPDGTVDTLDAATGLLLGVMDSVHETATVQVPPGSILLAYTDGLIERRDRDLSEGLESVRRLLADVGPDGASDLCDRLLEENPTDDDTAVLAIVVRD